MTHARGMAIVAVTLLGVCLIAFAYDVITDFPRALAVLAAVAIGAGLCWEGLIRTGALRLVLLTIGGLAVAAALIAIGSEGVPLGDIVVIALFAAGVTAARLALGVHTPLPSAPDPQRPTLFVNPRSGGGKAEKVGLAAAARERGYEVVELHPGDDLRVLVDEAVAQGADGLAMAGGDGSQAIVAAAAAKHGLPYACIPSGTRNHFALDLGVDREDIVGALDAFVGGGEHIVDLAEVNDQVFVNNVSLGLYAVAVQRDEYRDAKIKTLLDTIPAALGPGGERLDLRWHGPGGHHHTGGVTILVSNNRYRLGRALGNATRPRIDDGLLGITVLGEPRSRGERLRLQRPWREWSATSFEVDSSAPVPCGIDGEAVQLDPPLRFEIRPAVLRARIAAAHPGASPSADMPESAISTVGRLAAIAAGKDVK